MMEPCNKIIKSLIFIITILMVENLIFNPNNSFAQAPFATPDNAGSGNCLSFDGVDDMVDNIGQLGSFNFIQNTGVFTLEAWIQLDDPDAIRWSTILGSTSATAEKGFTFRFASTMTQTKFLEISVLKGIGGSPVIYSNSPNFAIVDSDWHHVAAVGNGTLVTFYVDGVNIGGSGTMSAFSSGNSTRVLSIGETKSSGFYGNDYHFPGDIEEVRIWNTARTQAQIRDYMNQKLLGNESGLMGYWNMNEGTGTTVTDLTTNANHGTRQ